MTPLFSVLVTARFERDYRRLLKSHAQLASDFASAIIILQQDPYNRSRHSPIKKLENVSSGDGQYRPRSGRFRFRYDIDRQSVHLKYCGLRRENTYR